MRLFCINRNILECKDVNSEYAVTLTEVLIETYWNVKDGLTAPIPRYFDVLIETYWNVKMRSQKKDRQVFRY